MTEKKLVIVLGPTAVGKSAFAIQLANHFKTEIISADSRQFYQELKIGVARPSEKELASVVHHFIGFTPISNTFSAGLFEEEAMKVITRLFESHDVVVCTGGSTLYLDALVYGLDALPSDEKVRGELNDLLKTKGIEALVSELKKRDPEYAAEVDVANPHRVIRALEVCRITGQKYSAQRTGKVVTRPFKSIRLGLFAQRQALYDRINQRVDEMVANGLEVEARGLYSHRDLNSLNTVGYKEFFSFFDGEMSRENAIDKIKQHSRNYAKRQLTWWRKQEDIHWLNVAVNRDLLKEATELIQGT